MVTKAFTPRLTIPESGNPYYNRKDSGGYSDAINGKPTQDGLNVLSNCVGYAYGRFNEIVGAGYMKYLAPVNAEQFIDFRNYREKGLEYGQEPKLGAVAVWQAGPTKKSADGAGHVAVVEVINSDGSIVTSESGYNAKKPFWTQTRKKGNGNWGQSSTYKFLGFIYQPYEMALVRKDKIDGMIRTTRNYLIYNNYADAIAKRNEKGLYLIGNYFVYKTHKSGAVNISRSKDAPGGWVVLDSDMYYDKTNYKGMSFTEGLDCIKEDSSYANRAKIAMVNGVSDYKGSVVQNTLLLNLLKQGKLLRA